MRLIDAGGSVGLVSDGPVVGCRLMPESDVERVLLREFVKVQLRGLHSSVWSLPPGGACLGRAYLTVFSGAAWNDDAALEGRFCVEFDRASVQDCLYLPAWPPVRFHVTWNAESSSELLVHWEIDASPYTTGRRQTGTLPSMPVCYFRRPGVEPNCG